MHRCPDCRFPNRRHVYSQVVEMCEWSSDERFDLVRKPSKPMEANGIIGPNKSGNTAELNIRGCPKKVHIEYTRALFAPICTRVQKVHTGLGTITCTFCTNLHQGTKSTHLHRVCTFPLCVFLPHIEAYALYSCASFDMYKL